MKEKIKIFYNETFSSLKNPNYRLYFIGQAISLSGNWMQTVALAWLVLTLTQSGTALGFLVAAQFLPVLIFGPYGGLIADRYPKLKIIYITQSILAFLSLVLGILVFTNTVQIWMIYVLAIFSGLLTAVDNPTRRTFITEIVGEDQLINAVSLNSIEFNLAKIIGPALAAIIISSIGIAACFLINAFSFLAVLLALYRMDVSKLNSAKLVSRAKGQLMAGLRYVNSNSFLKNTLILMLIIGTFSFEFTVTLPLLAKVTFLGNASTYAMFTSTMGIGAILGGLYTASRKKISERLLAISAFLFGISMLLVSISPNMFFTLIGMLLVGMLSVNLTSMGNTILQIESVPEMRGRVMALWSVAIIGTTPIGGPIIGLISEQLNPRWGLAVGGFAAIVASGIGWYNYKKIK